jgi:hypothetical protein
MVNVLALGSLCTLVVIALVGFIVGRQAWGSGSVIGYGRNPGAFLLDLNVFSISTVVLAGVATLLDYGWVHNEVCLTPSAIYMESGGPAGSQSRPWSDVSGVTTWCRSGREGWLSRIDLQIRGGRTVVLAFAWPGQTDKPWDSRFWVRSIPFVWDALHPFKGAFDASMVQSGCPFAETARLVSPP